MELAEVTGILFVPVTLLFVILVVVALTLGLFFKWVANEDGGTKGISKNEYTSPSGKKRTAKKLREDHIV